MAQGPSGYVCYCPELRLYSYHVVDESKVEDDRVVDVKFDEPGLEDAIATHLAEGREEAAQLLAKITAFGRANPHHYVCFDTSKEEMTITGPKEFWKKHDAEQDLEEEG